MTSRKRLLILFIILFGYSVILIAVAGIGSIASVNIKKLGSTTQDLYEHPFAVSNAAANLKASLFQVRSSVLQIALVRQKVEYAEKTGIEIAAIDKEIRTNLIVIKGNFLGDMNQVKVLETKIDQWVAIRADILAAAQKGDFKSAEHLVRTVGSAKFDEIVPLVDYVLTFAQSKGNIFAVEAEEHSDRIISQTNKLLILLVLLVIATAAVVIWRVISLQNELSRIATTDYLTGIPNRRHFMELTERELRRSLRYGNRFALAVIDLDLFKRINDTYGHHVGDTVLKKFCEVCGHALRDSDILGRIGGEEFAIMLPNTSLLEAKEVLERVRKDIEDTDIKIGEASSLRFTASFGLTESTPKSTDLISLFKFADHALYQAKESGRNRVCVHEDNLS